MFKFGDMVYTKEGKLGVIVGKDVSILAYEVMFEDLDESDTYFENQLFKEKPAKHYYTVQNQIFTYPPKRVVFSLLLDAIDWSTHAKGLNIIEEIYETENTMLKDVVVIVYDGKVFKS